MSSPGAGVAPAVELHSTPTGEKPLAGGEELSAPEGWTKKLVPAKKTPKRKDVLYVAPDGEEIKSKRQLEKYLKAHPGGPASSDFDWTTGETPRRSARLIKTQTRLSGDSTDAEPVGKRAKRESGEGKENDVLMHDKTEEACEEEGDKDDAAADSVKDGATVQEAQAPHLHEEVNGTGHKESSEKQEEGKVVESADLKEEAAKLANEFGELAKDMVIDKEPVEQPAFGGNVELDVSRAGNPTDVDTDDVGAAKPRTDFNSHVTNNGEKIERLPKAEANGVDVDDKSSEVKAGPKADELPQFGVKKSHEGEVPQSAEPLESRSSAGMGCGATSNSKAVKRALHLSTVPRTILCRELEQEKLTTFCKKCILQQISGSLYVSGCPGTGKSLAVDKLMAECSQWTDEAATGAPEIVSLNCTSISKPELIFELVLKKMRNAKSQRCAASCLQEIRRLSTFQAPAHNHQRRMLLLILDEIDYLITKDQSVLYDLFRLSTLVNSRCILIGIANAIDLTERFLPDLRALECNPVVITFSAYTSDQILTVLKQRLEDLPVTYFDPASLELCARRVAAASGDMRQALHVCRLAIESVEEERERMGQTCTEPGCSTSDAVHDQVGSPGRGAPSGHTGYKVMIGDMAKALARTFRSPAVTTIQALPQHQQMVLCAAVRLFRRAKKDSTLGQLHASYVEFCKTTAISALSAMEFSSLCRVLADQALVKLGASREDRLRRVSLQVDESDVVFALQGVRFFRNILV